MENKSIQKQFRIAASRSDVWAAWTTEEGIKSFFAQDCSIELEIGGKFELYFLATAPKGSQGSEGCRILSYLPEQMLSFSWNAPPQFPSVRNGGKNTWVVLQFECFKPNETIVTLTHLGWQEGEEWDKVFDYFQNAWTSVLQWLQDKFSI